MSSSLMPVSSRTSLISVWISLSPFSLWPCGKPQKPRLFLKSRNSEDALSSNEFWCLITAPMDCSRATLYRHQKPMAIIILFFSLKVLISFTKLNSEGRSSSPVGYGIGIAEVVGSNPTRSTTTFCTCTAFCPRLQFLSSLDLISMLSKSGLRQKYLERANRCCDGVSFRQCGKMIYCLHEVT